MAELLFEIGAEEIPAGFVPPALKQLEDDLRKALDEARIGHGEVKAVGTPRRLCVWARDVAAKQADAQTQAFGPPVAQGIDAEGKPTQAAIGFARSQGVDVSELERVVTPKGERLAVSKVEKGKKSAEVLPGLLEKLVAGLRFKKAMRWGDETVAFARPVQWMVALFQRRPLAVRFGDVRAGAATFGHRFLANRPIKLSGDPGEYVAKLRKAFVIVDPQERRAMIAKQLEAAAKKEGGKLRDDEALLDQVNFLVEHPTAIAGAFEESNLALPPEVIVSEERGHQRYFAVVSKGKLSNKFIAVSATPVKDKKLTRRGYERVLRSRLADARFFYEEDKKRRLEDRVSDLGRRTYQAKLGSELERVGRIQDLAVALARAVGKAELAPQVSRVARLCKADLGTGMVGEFPELQGIMGRYYALNDGEPPEIADAIEDHYKPIGASEELPRGDLGALAGIADRLHALVGILGVGEKVTGAADPFGLRRACLGILRLVFARGYHLALSQAIDVALGALEGKLGTPPAQVKAAVLDFFRGRLKAQWSEEFDPDLVEAVLSAGFDDVVDARARLEALAQIKKQADFVPLAVAFKRVANIQEKGAAGAGRVDAGLLREEAEKGLAVKLDEIGASAREAKARKDYLAALRTVAGIKPAVDKFFDDVLVMADDVALKNNRLALMKGVGDLFADIADFRKIQAEPTGAPQARA